MITLSGAFMGTMEELVSEFPAIPCRKRICACGIQPRGTAPTFHEESYCEMLRDANITVRFSQVVANGSTLLANDQPERRDLPLPIGVAHRGTDFRERNRDEVLAVEPQVALADRDAPVQRSGAAGALEREHGSRDIFAAPSRLADRRGAEGRRAVISARFARFSGDWRRAPSLLRCD
ncbi:hypothetical protein [Paraburkholderia sp. CNPSo 3281]|uniref:hypothetical protein n=1 Tax=Paraburkholderia sp. CNPSo 3281 TaxID=2940933 RepID=UPI0020B7A1FF|nr:hypothetical protein [Paraburkholderia sp. CNPSo 3281]MCP3720353.1 hypothetical protein [Paraburkholderia sp. CNPSo 3281]